MLRKLFCSLVVTALAPIVFSTAVRAEPEADPTKGTGGQQAKLEAQDEQEREAALAFAESRGLDLSKAVESGTGLWTLVIEEGQGAAVKSENTVTAHCTGWLANGREFWSSHDGADKPMVNAVTGFVKGFTEGLQTMKSGGTSLFIFPGRLGYGPKGNPRAKIHPNATLIFEVEVLGVQ